MSRHDLAEILNAGLTLDNRSHQVADNADQRTEYSDQRNFSPRTSDKDAVDVRLILLINKAGQHKENAAAGHSANRAFDPSTDFFGLSFGAILCFPNALPAK